MKVLNGLVRRLSVAMVLTAGIFLTSMILLTCANIFLRMVWRPIPGTYELMGLCGAVVGAFALGYTQVKRGHIAVTILVDRFSGTTKTVLTALNHAICLVFFSLIAWKIWGKADILRNTGEVTETLRIIYHPFTYGVAIGCAALALVYFRELISVLRPDRENGA